MDSIAASFRETEPVLAEHRHHDMLYVGRRRSDLDPASPGSTANRATVSLMLVAANVCAFGALFELLTVFGQIAPGQSSLLILAAAATILAFWSRRLFPGYGIHFHERLRRRTIATGGVALFVCLVSWLVWESWHLTALAAAFLSGGAGLASLAEHGMAIMLRKAGLWGETAVVIKAAPQDEAAITAYLQDNWRYGLNPLPRAQTAGRRVPVAMIADGTFPTASELALLRQSFDEVLLLADLPGVRLTGFRSSDFSGEIGLRIPLREDRARGRLLYRLLDLAVAIPAAILALPLIGAAAIAIRLVDRGPVFFRQLREGRDGRVFLMLKLRSMYCDADDRLNALLRDDPAARAEWETHFKLRRDPRVLPFVGPILRGLSIDELPQLLNVLTGEMRVVGPRPFPDYHLAAMDGRFRIRRSSVTPGLTGLWQVTARGTSDIRLQEQIDDFYIANQSIWLDLAILLSTTAAVLQRRGAY